MVIFIYTLIVITCVGFLLSLLFIIICFCIICFSKDVKFRLDALIYGLIAIPIGMGCICAKVTLDEKIKVINRIESVHNNYTKIDRIDFNKSVIDSSAWEVTVHGVGTIKHTHIIKHK